MRYVISIQEYHNYMSATYIHTYIHAYNCCKCFKTFEFTHFEMSWTHRSSPVYLFRDSIS